MWWDQTHSFKPSRKTSLGTRCQCHSAPQTRCKYLHAAVGAIKCRTNAVTSGWDNKISDALLTQMIAESVETPTHEDPAQGEWCINREEINLWVDAISLALGILLEKVRAMLEDVLVAVCKRCLVHQPSCWMLGWKALTWHYSGKQRGCSCTLTPIVSITGCPTHWPESKNMHQGSKRDADKAKARHLKENSLVFEYNLTVSVSLATSYCNLLTIWHKCPTNAVVLWRWEPSLEKKKKEKEERREITLPVSIESSQQRIFFLLLKCKT